MALAIHTCSWSVETLALPIRCRLCAISDSLTHFVESVFLLNSPQLSPARPDGPLAHLCISDHMSCLPPSTHLCLGSLPHLCCGKRRQSSGQSGNSRQSRPSLPTPGIRAPTWAPPVAPALDVKSGVWSSLVLSDRGGWDRWALGCTALIHLEREAYPYSHPHPYPLGSESTSSRQNLFGDGLSKRNPSSEVMSCFWVAAASPV